MSTFNKVKALISRLAPEPICDACVARLLGLDPANVAAKTSELVARSDHARMTGQCSQCESETRVVAFRG